jgi:hypothetical protein
MQWTTHRNERGFILATALIAMVVVGAAVVAGYFVANQEFHVGKSVRESMASFYTGQAGLQREFANWPIAQRWTMQGGQTINVGPVTLPNGTAYRGTITRVDNVPESDTDSERYYVVSLTGIAPAPLIGQEVRSRQAMFLRVRYYDFCCTAAITAKDTVVQAGSTEIDGNNNEPLTWAGQCDSVDNSAVAGAEVECSTCYVSEGTQDSQSGDPAIEVDTTLQPQSLTEWEEVNFEFLASKAQKVYAPGATASPTVPVTNPDPITALPVCDETVKNNWGEPTDPLHDCFDYFPTIYGEGDLLLEGNTYGQGMLIVEGNLFVKGSYRFYGIILVKGHLILEGTSATGGPKIIGSAIVAGQTAPGDSITNSRIAGDAAIQYSACAVSRAKRFAELARKQPLPLRSWTEALN